MNILFLTNAKIPHLGGKSSHIVELSNGLRTLGHNVHIISESSIGFIGSLIMRIRKLFILHYKKSDFGEYSYKSMNITNLAIQNCLRRYLKAHKVDIISAQDPSSAIIAFHAAKHNIPITLTMHSYFGKIMDEVSTSKRGIRQKDIDRNLHDDLESLKIVKYLICVDSRIEDDCVQFLKRMNLTLPICSIPNFVNTNDYNVESCKSKELSKLKLGIEQTKSVIICIRRLVDKNGVIYGIDAMKNLDNCVLLVGGDGPNMEKLKCYVNENALNDRVVFLGGIKGELKNLVYSAADFAIVPSITLNGLQEATSISAIESMSCGIPTIASEIGGLKQLIDDGKNGVLVPEQNSEAISNAICDLINNQEKYTGPRSPRRSLTRWTSPRRRP